ncbi:MULTISPECIES: dihydrolipoamide acetyltransferase family protein [unclassified Arthrobacter]|uniref:dihydrolipoamide acetyltransferase family protein n=1 Tax=unclassified Arthrobacter TaxID=235627 RepID=UPI00149291DF|nr:dihydrolipoamide acetyltransferase family protein [Arthrobacter sp. AET 35A]MBE0009299.1 2-oxo acid dehydrogenase subunit E2 [Arthrobacter sp. AET 35A]NOJ63134.1 2-oxo acid dehydrogenase subunit E2 [Arthrobacter sp. 147(2020)]
MIKEFRLPDLGEGLTESEIVSWHVAEGDIVELNQIIADVETAKAVVELPSPYAGVVARLHEQPGTVVEVGAPIISFDVPSAGGSDGGGAGVGGPAAADSDGAGGDDAVPAKREPNLVGYGAAVEKGGRPSRRPRGGAAGAPPAPAASAPAPAPAPAPVAVVAPASPETSASTDRPRSTPPVRKLARDLRIELESVTGTGPNGLITREDVLAASDNANGGASDVVGSVAPTKTPAPSGHRETRAPIKGMRKHTAAAMVASAFTAPHVTEFLTIDVTPTMDLVARLKASRAFADVKITPLTLVAKALCIAVDRNPTINTRWDEASAEIVQHHYVNLGIAAATPRGLMVPNLKDADRMSLLELARALTTLTETARAGKTTPADLSGGTISITNVGVFGIDAGTPILNPGEAAILAMGAVRRTPWEYQGEIALRSVMTLSLSFDHRLVDGEQGSRFLADIGTILSDPGMVLTMI